MTFQENLVLHYLSPVARTTVALFTEHSFEYEGINDDFYGSVTYKGWSIEPCVYQPVLECEPDDFMEESFISVIWLETEDCWSRVILDDEFDSNEDAIAYVIDLIDKAEATHSASPGQLSLFVEE